RADRPAHSGGVAMKQRLIPTLILGMACLALSGAGQGVSPAPVQPPNASDVQDLVLLADARPMLVRLHIRIDDRPYPAVWHDFIQHLFNYLDINGDGTLDPDELERVPSAELLLGRGGAGFIVRPDERLRPSVPLARNKDGKVTVTELADYYRKHGLAPLQLQLGATPRTMATGPRAIG